MKQALTRTALKLYHIVNDECVLGLHANLSGVVSPDLRGDVSGLRGVVSLDLRGNIDDCDLSDNDRKAGVDVASLVAQ